MTEATVTIEEAVGATPDTVDLTSSYLHLLSADVHSPQTSTGYTTAPLDGSMTEETVYSYERWIRARFEPPFTAVYSFRFFSPTVATLPTGWNFSIGSSSDYIPPVGGEPSAIATTPLPASDPGRRTPNCGGVTPLTGDTTQYSDWIVIQASVDAGVADPGPAFGYTDGDTPNLIEFAFVWTETD